MVDSLVVECLVQTLAHKLAVEKVQRLEFGMVHSLVCHLVVLTVACWVERSVLKLAELKVLGLALKMADSLAQKLVGQMVLRLAMKMAVSLAQKLVVLMVACWAKRSVQQLAEQKVLRLAVKMAVCLVRRWVEL